MQILVVGGTGLTGAHTALYLKELGHDVSLMSRNKPAVKILQEFPHICHDYIHHTGHQELLSGYDSMVFAAGADLRLLPNSEQEGSFFEQANIIAIPRFFEAARKAGIRRSVLVGSYYPQVVPEKIESSVYVRSRYLSDREARALSTPEFSACSVNAPFILGNVTGVVVPHLKALVQYAAGMFDGMELIAPAGGVNHISVKSMSEAIHSALIKGEAGKSYLVGDENLSWKQYLELFCKATGNPRVLDITTDEHPMFPDAMLYAGRNALIEYEPDTSIISYSRGNVRSAIEDVVTAYL